MALVGEIVARFKAETSDYLKKIDEAKAKNKDLATQLVATAGSAEKALATLHVAKGKGALADLGIDPRQLAGVTAALKDIDKETRRAAEGAEQLAKRQKKLWEDIAEEAANAHTADAFLASPIAPHATTEPQQNDPNKALNAAGRKANALGDLGDAAQAIGRGDVLRAYEKLVKAKADLSSGEGLTGGLKAALVLTGVNMIGDGLAKATGKAIELRKQFDEGTISAGQMVQEIGQTIPILGNFVKAGRDIRELITEENLELEKQKKLWDAIAEAATKARTAAAARREARDEARKTTAEVEADSAAKVAGLAGMQGTKAFDEMTGKADAEFNKFREDLTKKYAAQIAAEQQKIDAIFAANGGRAVSGNKAAAVQTSEDLIERLKRERDETIKGRADAMIDNVSLGWQEQFGKKTVAQVDAESMAKGFIDKFKAGLKESPLVAWLKKQADEGKKEWDKARQDAAKFTEDAKSDAEKLGEKFQEALRLKSLGLLSGDTVDKLMTKDTKDLQRQKKDILDSEHNVYDLPPVKELRMGQALFVPPTKIDEKQLEKLVEINENLKVIKEKGEAGGITVEELSI